MGLEDKANGAAGTISPDITKEMQAAARQRYVFNPKFTKLVGNFTAQDKILEGKPIQKIAEDIMKKYPEEDEGTSLLTLRKQEPETFCILQPDLHGSYATWQNRLNSLFTEYMKGKNAYLGILGDPNHPLLEQREDGNLVTVPIDIKLVPERTDLDTLMKREKELREKYNKIAIPKERDDIRKELAVIIGNIMFKKNLAIKDEEHERFVMLPYRDGTLQIISDFTALAQMLPGKVFMVDGDHDKCLRTPGFEIFKGDINFAYFEKEPGRFTPEEMAYIRNELNKQKPVAMTENGFLLLHGGPLKINNKKELENIVRDHKTPTRDGTYPDEETYQKRLKNWYENTVEGRLIMGHEEEKETGDEIEKDGKIVKEVISFRTYKDSEISQTLEATGANAIIGAHSGNHDILIVHEDGTEIQHRSGVEGLLDLDGMMLIAGPESRDGNKARDGQDRTGLGKYENCGVIDLGAEFEKSFYRGRTVEDATLYPLRKKRKTQIAVPDISKTEPASQASGKTTLKLTLIVDQIADAIKVVFEEDEGWHPELYENFVRRNLPEYRDQERNGKVDEQTLSDWKDTLIYLKTRPLKKTAQFGMKKGDYIQLLAPKARRLFI